MQSLVERYEYSGEIGHKRLIRLIVVSSANENADVDAVKVLSRLTIMRNVECKSEVNRDMRQGRSLHPRVLSISQYSDLRPSAYFRSRSLW